jgi:hypothetical protein
VSSAAVWGATAAECADSYPCDGLGFAHDDIFFRAIDVAAPPALTFRWLCQLRAAPYSYDWLDNFGRRSPPRLIPGLEQLAVGQRIMIVFRLIGFSSGTSLTVRSQSRIGDALMGSVAGSYVVRAVPEGSRLIAKVLVKYPHGPYGRALRTTMPHADLFMFRKQLLTLRRYAERDAGDPHWLEKNRAI